jgi:hypothetical protein
MTAKSIAIKRRDGRSGRCVVKAVKLTSGELHCYPEARTGHAAGRAERGAEVSRRQSRLEAGEAIEALRSRKVERTDRPNRNVSNRRPGRGPRGLEGQRE